MSFFKMLSAPVRIYLLERELRKIQAKNDKTPHISLLFLGVVGGMSLNWAKIEALLDSINEMAFFNGGKDEIEGQVPRGLDRKIQFLRKSHNRLPWLAEIAAEANVIADRIIAVRDDRHQLIHGLVTKLDPPDAIYAFVRNEYGPFGLRKVEKTYSLDDLHRLAEAMVSISQALEDHLHAVALAFVHDRDLDLNG